MSEVARARLLKQSQGLMYEYMTRPWSSGGKKTAVVIHATNYLETHVQVTIERVTCCLDLDVFSAEGSGCDAIDVNIPSQTKNVDSSDASVWQFVVRSQVPFTGSTFCDFEARTSTGKLDMITVKMSDIEDRLAPLPDDLLTLPPQSPPPPPPPPPRASSPSPPPSQSPCSNPDEALSSQGICTGSDANCVGLYGQAKVPARPPAHPQARTRRLCLALCADHTARSPSSTSFRGTARAMGRSRHRRLPRPPPVRSADRTASLRARPPATLVPRTMSACASRDGRPRTRAATYSSAFRARSSSTRHRPLPQDRTASGASANIGADMARACMRARALSQHADAPLRSRSLA